MLPALLLALCPAAPAPLPRPVAAAAPVTARDVRACTRLEWCGGEYEVRLDRGGCCRVWSGPSLYAGRWSFAAGVLSVEEWAADEPWRTPYRWSVRLRRTPGGLVGEGATRVRLWRAR